MKPKTLAQFWARCFDRVALACRLITYWPARSMLTHFEEIGDAHRPSKRLPDVVAQFHVGCCRPCGAAAAAPRASRAGLPLCGSGPDNVWQRSAARGIYCLGNLTGLRGSSLRFPPKQQSLGSPGKGNPGFVVKRKKKRREEPRSPVRYLQCPQSCVSTWFVISCLGTPTSTGR